MPTIEMGYRRGTGKRQSGAARSTFGAFPLEYLMALAGGGGFASPPARILRIFICEPGFATGGETRCGTFRTVPARLAA